GLQKQIQSGEVKELRLVLKADVQGSVEALAEALERLSTEEVKLKVIHSSVGAINESDVMLASASNAIVIGFNVKPETKAASQAQANGVDIRSYNVIYDAIDDLRAALAGMLAAAIRETCLGRAQVRQVFVIASIGLVCGRLVAGGEIGSLKAKRHVLKGLKERVRARFEVSVAEVDHQDVWQRATLAVAYVSADARHANEVVSKAMDFIEDNVDGRVLETFVEIL